MFSLGSRIGGRNLHTRILLGSAVEINSCGNVEAVRLSPGEDWAVIQSQQRPQLVPVKFWSWDSTEKLFQIEAMNQLVKSPHRTVIVFRWEGRHVIR